MTLINYTVLRKDEQVHKGSYCASNYAWPIMRMQIEHDLQKVDVKPNTGLTIAFVNPTTNKKTVVEY